MENIILPAREWLNAKKAELKSDKRIKSSEIDYDKGIITATLHSGGKIEFSYEEARNEALAEEARELRAMERSMGARITRENVERAAAAANEFIRNKGRKSYKTKRARRSIGTGSVVPSSNTRKVSTQRTTRTSQRVRNTAVEALVTASRGKTAKEIKELIKATVGVHISTESAERAAAANAAGAAAANAGAAGGAGANSKPKGFVMQKSTLNSVIRNAVKRAKPDVLNALVADITEKMGSTTLGNHD
jgi:hypothetical protein